MAEKEPVEVQDFVVVDSWTDKDGNEQTAVRKVGVSIKMKGGGWRHKLYRNVSISNEALSLPRKEKAAEAGDDAEGAF